MRALTGAGTPPDSGVPVVQVMPTGIGLQLPGVPVIRPSPPAAAERHRRNTGTGKTQSPVLPFTERMTSFGAVGLSGKR